MHKDFIHLVPMTFIRVLISEQIRSPQLICVYVQSMRLTVIYIRTHIALLLDCLVLLYRVIDSIILHDLLRVLD